MASFAPHARKGATMTVTYRGKDKDRVFSLEKNGKLIFEREVRRREQRWYLLDVFFCGKAARLALRAEDTDAQASMSFDKLVYLNHAYSRPL